MEQGYVAVGGVGKDGTKFLLLLFTTAGLNWKVLQSEKKKAYRTGNISKQGHSVANEEVIKLC